VRPAKWRLVVKADNAVLILLVAVCITFTLMIAGMAR
jgi:hypothetical protein